MPGAEVWICGACHPPSGRLRAYELTWRESRPERVRAIWAALSPARRERAWSLLDDQQRVDAIGILVGATEAER